MRYLGIDTSNYTTSAAIYDSDSGTVVQKKMLLPVKAGERGLRQSDAVFHHTVQLPQIMESLFAESKDLVDGIGVSVFPRRETGSYMPCFLTGKATAHAISAVTGVFCAEFSHQEGHIAAALYSAKQLQLLTVPFLAFHISGGTTEALLVTPDSEQMFRVQCVARSLDLKAGQLIDRVGVSLGLRFPCGKALEKLSDESTQRYHLRPTMKGADCCLSGLENQCQKMLANGETPENIAQFCMSGVLAALIGMVDALQAQYPHLPILFSGGVASNKMLRTVLSKKYNAYFAEPEFSADNAAGIAILTASQAEGKLYDV